MSGDSRGRQHWKGGGRLCRHLQGGSYQAREAPCKGQGILLQRRIS